MEKNLKKEYQKPEIKIVEFMHSANLLEDSDVIELGSAFPDIKDPLA
jgi:hypothetical protein